MKINSKFLAASLFAGCLMHSPGVRAQDANPMEDDSKAQGDLIVASMTGHVFKPAKVAATDERVKQLKVPAGFQVSKFAENLSKPRMMTIMENGNVYVTSRDAGTVTLLQDKNKDGKADETNVVATRENMHGIAVRGNKMYLVTAKEVFATDIKPDGSLGDLQLLIGDLPDAGQHMNRTIAFGPDGKLYITVGSTCNACKETSEESATIVQMNEDGSGRKVYAKGLRNTIGFGWHPETKALYGFDHGIDWLGDESQEEELNQIVEGGDYGWPYVYENGKPNPADEPPQGLTYAQYAKKTKPPVLTYTAHSAPLGMVFYTGTQFPEVYKNDAFVAMHGSWNRSEPSGYKLVRVRFENGKPTAFEDFMTGFLVDDNQAQFGRIVGIAQHPDGSLLVSDDANGAVYRIAYRK